MLRVARAAFENMNRHLQCERLFCKLEISSESSESELHSWQKVQLENRVFGATKIGGKLIIRQTHNSACIFAHKGPSFAGTLRPNNHFDVIPQSRPTCSCRLR